MLTPLRPGVCYSCQHLVWRVAIAARSIESQNITAGQPFLLWPLPESLYARLRTDSGSAPGITFCPDCAPEIGSYLVVLVVPMNPTGVPMREPYTVSGPVIGLDSALSRYSDWYAPERESFWRSWLKDALSLESAEITALMVAWNEDRGAHV